MFVAKLLNQKSLIYNAVNSTELRFEFEPNTHAGSWYFNVTACVDRRMETANFTDCDPGYNKVELEFVLCADIEDADQYPVCSNGQPEPEPEEEDEDEDPEEIDEDQAEEEEQEEEQEAVEEN